MLRKPFADLRMLVGGVIVDDRMDLLTLGDLRVDLIEEADETPDADGASYCG